MAEFCLPALLSIALGVPVLCLSLMSWPLEMNGWDTANLWKLLQLRHQEHLPAKQETDWKGAAWEILLQDRCVYTREAQHQQGEDTEPASDAAGGTPAGVTLSQAQIPTPHLPAAAQQQMSPLHALPACHWGERTDQ